MEQLPDPCTECGFDHDLYDRADTLSSQRIVAPVLEAAIEGLDEDVLTRRSDRDAEPISNLSIAEVIEDVLVAASSHRVFIERARDPDDDSDGGALDLGFAAGSATMSDTLSAVSSEYDRITALVSPLDGSEWDRPIGVGGKILSVGWFARQALHDGFHALADIGRLRHQFGRGAESATGRVEHLHVSTGGVPKQPISVAAVGPEGLDGDAQADRRHHGRPVQAVCLWSSDVIAALEREGHPIAAGNAGENITISGVEWATLRPGTRVDVGPVSMLISAHAIPCAKNAQWFSDRDFNRILHDHNPGFSRLYGIPLNRGTVNVGDLVTVEP